jgi:hypothetical protein
LTNGYHFGQYGVLAVTPTFQTDNAPRYGLGISGSECPQATPTGWQSARAEYDRAVEDLLEALKRYSNLTLTDAERAELTRVPRERERAAFARYKEALDVIHLADV